jgi:hypothetical protein
MMGIIEALDRFPDSKTIEAQSLMDLDLALSLADFLNERSTRFQAKILAFGSHAWVIVADAHPGETRQRYLEPIADPGSYLRRAAEGVLSLHPEYHALLEEWTALVARADTRPDAAVPTERGA